MQILIRLGNMAENLTIKIDDEKSIFLVNKEKKDVNITDFIMRLQIIVASWQPVMIDDSIIDGSWYEVEMKMGDKTRKYIGRNAFPLDYNSFIQLINEVAEW